jgi:hypothetical protein
MSRVAGEAWERMSPTARDAAKAAWGGWSRLTWHSRLLPDYCIIGTQRGGTTSLYNYLVGHPAVARVLTKELRYFDVQHHRGEAWYRSRFPSHRHAERVARRAGTPMVVGEASPDYLFYPEVPSRVAEMVPDVKLIVLLREPVARAHSHYWHQVKRGFETLPVAEALACEAERTRDPVLGVDPDTHHFSYLARGRYAEQLERWFAHFPRERFLILRSEDLFRDPARTFSQVLRFLELPEWQPAAYPDLNRMAGARMEPALEEAFGPMFVEPNRHLGELLGPVWPGWPA